MSAARQSRPEPAQPTPALADIAELRARRRQARRTRRLARVDVGLGAFGALVLLIASPGLAITGLIAVLVLAACLISTAVQRRIRRRANTVSVDRPRARTGASTRRPA
jgi:Flp pilus assembly protein TadB